jgi:hypothetical protein
MEEKTHSDYAISKYGADGSLARLNKRASCYNS